MRRAWSGKGEKARDYLAIFYKKGLNQALPLWKRDAQAQAAMEILRKRRPL